MNTPKDSTGGCCPPPPCSAPLRPPHAAPDHPHHAYYRPDTDDYPPEEAEIEAKWRQTKGVDDDGKAWLTPRMERNAIALAERMDSWPNHLIRRCRKSPRLNTSGLTGIACMNLLDVIYERTENDNDSQLT